MKRSTNRKAAKSLTGLFNEAALQHYKNQPESINDNLNRYFKSLQMASSSATSTPMAQDARRKTAHLSEIPSTFETEQDSYTFTDKTAAGHAANIQLHHQTTIQQTESEKGQPKNREQPVETSSAALHQQTFSRKVPTARKTIRNSAKSLEQIKRLKKMEKKASQKASSSALANLSQPQSAENIEITTSHSKVLNETVQDDSMSIDSGTLKNKNSKGATKRQKEPVEDIPSKKFKKQKSKKSRSSLQLLQNEANWFITYTEDLPKDQSVTLLQERHRKLRKRSAAPSDISNSSRSDIINQTNKDLPAQMKKNVIKKATSKKPRHTTESKTTKHSLIQSPEKVSTSRTRLKLKRSKTGVQKVKSRKPKSALPIPKVTNQLHSPANETEPNVRGRTSHDTESRLTGHGKTPKDVWDHVVKSKTAKTKETDFSSTTSSKHLLFMRRQLSSIREPIMFSGVIERSYKASMSGHKFQMKQSVIESVVTKYNKKLLQHGHAHSSAVDKLSNQAVMLLDKETVSKFPESFWKQASRDLNFECPAEIPSEHFATRDQFRRYDELAKKIRETRRERKDIMAHVRQSAMLLYELDALKKVGDKMLLEKPGGHLDAQLRAKKFRTALNDAKRVSQLFNVKSKTD